MKADSFFDWMMLCVRQMPERLSTEREAFYSELLRSVDELLKDRGDRELWNHLPGVLRMVTKPIGWEWNGIYEARGGSLVLRASAGPPVCHELERSGGLGTSGMCFDCLMSNQTLVAAEVKDWPGYVSCDGESGLATRAGMVCPIRDKDQRPAAVWDLDSTTELHWSASIFMDRLISALSLIEPWQGDRDS